MASLVRVQETDCEYSQVYGQCIETRTLYTLPTFPRSYIDSQRQARRPLLGYHQHTQKMPSPPAARSISSYFNKSPAKSVAAAAAASTSTGTSTVSAATDDVKTTIAETTTSSSPVQPPLNRTGFLSDAARKAIEEGAAEVQPAKKAKLSDGSAKPSERSHYSVARRLAG